MLKAEEIITRQLAQRLARRGFSSKDNLLLARQWGEAEAQIRCSVRKDKDSGQLLVTLMLGIRFEPIENILGRTSDPTRPTIATEIYSLHEDRRCMEWDLGRPETLALLVDEIENFAIPFFERYSTLDGLNVKLQGDHPSEARTEALAAILVHKGSKDSALAMLDREITSAQESSIPPVVARRFRLQKLRDRLSTNGGK